MENDEFLKEPKYTSRRRRRTTEAEAIFEDGSDESVNAEETAAVAEEEVVEAVVEERASAEESKDIGNWKFTPWRGIPMYTHRRTLETSFDLDYVRRRRKQ